MSKSKSDPENHPRIAIATGTRADWGLLLPLARQLHNMGVRPMVAATHAHFFEELGMTVSEITDDGFGPCCRIPTARTPAEATADALRGFAAFLDREKPDMLVILGDRFEMLGAASAALLAGVPVAHIAGGNVTEGAYDDAIRNAISQMAALHLPETELCARRLMGMGIPADRVVCAGSPGVYNALNEPLMSLAELRQSLGHDIPDDFLLATLHPATLDPVSPQTRMHDFLAALRRHLTDNPDRGAIITYPNSDSDPTPLIRLIEDFRNEFPRRVVTLPSLGRVRYLSAAALCTAVIGNSSSAIEETPSLGVPTLDIGIRQKGREHGDAVLHCDADTESITDALAQICTPAWRQRARKADNPYYRPQTPRIQATAIFDYLGYRP